MELKWCKSRQRLSVAGGECTGSASTRHALTTGGDTRDIDRRSLAVRAKDVMGNMKAVVEQYDKLLRRYCNNFHNKKLRAFFLLFGVSGNANNEGAREMGRGMTQFAQQCINSIVSPKKTRRFACTITTMLINLHLMQGVLSKKLFKILSSC